MGSRPKHRPATSIRKPGYVKRLKGFLSPSEFKKDRDPKTLTSVILVRVALKEVQQRLIVP